MTKGIRENEPSGRDVYPDIIDHPHWESPTRPRMSLAERAAQFSPFNALSGYQDMVSKARGEVETQFEESVQRNPDLN